MCGSVSVFRVQADVSASALASSIRSKDPTVQCLLADVHFWNYQGREVLVYSLIDEATRFHVTQILPSQSARDLYEAIMNVWVKWARDPRFLLTLADHIWSVSSLHSWEPKARPFS